MSRRIVPILALIPFGFGMVSIFLTCQTYIVDAFPMYAASAVAATTCLRSIVGTFLVSDPEVETQQTVLTHQSHLQVLHYSSHWVLVGETQYSDSLRSS
jgi:hypothetical protein